MDLSFPARFRLARLAHKSRFSRKTSFVVSTPDAQLRRAEWGGRNQTRRTFLVSDTCEPALRSGTVGLRLRRVTSIVSPARVRGELVRPVRRWPPW